MKIAVVIPKYGLVGGAERFAFMLSEQMATRDDFEIHVFANQWRRENYSITFHRIPIIAFPRFMRPISFAYFANKKVCQEDFDLVHSHDRIFQMDLLTMHGVPHKTWIQEARLKPLSLFDRAMTWVEEKGITGSHMPMILPVSTLVKDELLKLYDIPESKIRVIHPGVSSDRFSTMDQESCRHEVRQRHGLSPSDVVVLFVGMNFEIKRLELVLQGVAHFVRNRDKDSNLKLLVVGKGEERRYLRMAREMGIVDRVIFAGVIQKVEDYYLASDIFAMPSRFDTFGLAVLEAMMAGLPVIITQRVGARDLIDSGVQGFVLPEEPSISDISEKLAFLVEKENRIKMGESAREVALCHTWDKTVDQVADVYQQLIG
ncbi:MAG: glycosyltransferase family 4 protein [Desulfatiglandales bacterium]